MGNLFYWNNKNVKSGDVDKMDAAEWLVYTYNSIDHIKMAFDARFAWDAMPERLKEEYNFDFNNFQKESRLCLYLLIIIAVIFILVGSFFVLKLYYR